MTSRRSFFTRLAQFAAVVAIAPQICFGRKLEVAAPVEYWAEQTSWSTCTRPDYDLLVGSSKQADAFQAAMIRYYQGNWEKCK